MGTKMYFIQEGIVDIVMSNGEVITMIFFATRVALHFILVTRWVGRSFGLA